MRTTTWSASVSAPVLPKTTTHVSYWWRINSSKNASKCAKWPAKKSMSWCSSDNITVYKLKTKFRRITNCSCNPATSTITNKISTWSGWSNKPPKITRPTIWRYNCWAVWSVKMSSETRKLTNGPTISDRKSNRPTSRTMAIKYTFLKITTNWTISRIRCRTCINLYRSRILSWRIIIKICCLDCRNRIRCLIRKSRW